MGPGSGGGGAVRLECKERNVLSVVVFLDHLESMFLANVDYLFFFTEYISTLPRSCVFFAILKCVCVCV